MHILSCCLSTNKRDQACRGDPELEDVIVVAGEKVIRAFLNVQIQGFPLTDLIAYTTSIAIVSLVNYNIVVLAFIDVPFVRVEIAFNREGWQIAIIRLVKGEGDGFVARRGGDDLVGSIGGMKGVAEQERAISFSVIEKAYAVGTASTFLQTSRVVLRAVVHAESSLDGVGPLITRTPIKGIHDGSILTRA
jgi:uncharacterized protein YqfA (UPF0365 family)